MADVVKNVILNIIERLDDRSVAKTKKERKLLNKASQQSGRDILRTRRELRNEGIDLKKLSNKGKGWRDEQRRLNQSTNRLRRSSFEFKGEWLSLMFAGMALAGVMKSILSPAADLVGLFKIFQTSMAVLFLPVMLMLLPVFLFFLKTILNLSDRTKKVIGVIAIVVLVLGTLAAIVGMVILGIAGLAALFGSGAAAGIFVAILAGVVLALGLIAGWIVYIIDLYKEFNSLTGSTFESVGLVITKLMDRFNPLVLILRTIILMMVRLKDFLGLPVSEFSRTFAEEGLTGLSLNRQGITNVTNNNTEVQQTNHFANLLNSKYSIFSVTGATIDALKG